MGEKPTKGLSAQLSVLIGDAPVAEFARKCKLGDSLVRKYLDGAEPGRDNIEKIWRGTGCNLEWLVSGEGVPFSGTPGAAEAERRKHERVVMVPRYEGPASHASGQVAEKVAFALQFIRGLPQSDPELLGCYPMNADGMQPSLFHDDWVLFDQSVTDVTVEDIYLVNIGGDTFIKRLRRLPGNVVEVISDNRAKYSPVAYDASVRESEEFQVVGKYLWRGGTRLGA